MNHKKAFLKTLSWRAVSSAAFFVVILIWSQDLEAASIVTITDAIIKTILYYAHELAWQGKMKGNKHEHFEGRSSKDR